MGTVAKVFYMFATAFFFVLKTMIYIINMKFNKMENWIPYLNTLIHGQNVLNN